MSKVLYGILNYRRSIDETKAIYESVPAEDHKDIMIVRQGTMNFNDKKTFSDITKKADKSVAVSKNMILKHAKDNGYDYCFIIEDDVVIKDEKAFNMYINLMEEIDYPVLFYGFDNRNRVLGNVKPNPCFAIRVSDDREIYCSRNACSSVLLFKVSDDMIMFDESLKALETEMLLWDLKQDGKIHSYGFFPDIPFSWNYFENTGEKKIRVLTAELGAEDLKKRQTQITLDIEADKFLQFLQSKYEES